MGVSETRYVAQRIGRRTPLPNPRSEARDSERPARRGSCPVSTRYLPLRHFQPPRVFAAVNGMNSTVSPITAALK